MRLQLGFVAVLIGFALPMVARAQAFGGASLFEPEVDIVESGIVMDVQATVSADRKYVTMTMRSQQSQLLSLQTFQFQGGGGAQLPQGVAGGVNPVAGGGAGGAVGGGGGGNVVPQRVNAPMKLTTGNGGAILMKRGITPLVKE